MHLEQTIKLDYQDVLIRPKRSALPSRAEVDIQREFTFKHSGQRYKAIPIIAANMDTVGTMEMAAALGPLGLSVALHKHYGVDALVKFFTSNPHPDLHFYSMGITRADHTKFEQVLARAGTAIRNVCIDVANGYTESFVRFVESFRQAHPKLTVMAGNIVTGEMTEELILSGADIVFRYSDTVADIAFLLMDLEYHGGKNYAASLWNYYRSFAGEQAVEPLLDFYKAYRAVCAER